MLVLWGDWNELCVYVCARVELWALRLWKTHTPLSHSWVIFIHVVLCEVKSNMFFRLKPINAYYNPLKETVGKKPRSELWIRCIVAALCASVRPLLRCTDQGPWVGGQGPSLVGQWVVTQGPGGHWMTGRTHGGQDQRLLKTAASSPSDEDWKWHKVKQGTEIKMGNVEGFDMIGEPVQWN